MSKQTELIDKIVTIAQNHSFDGINVDCIERDLEELLSALQAKHKEELKAAVIEAFEYAYSIDDCDPPSKIKTATGYYKANHETK